MEAQWEGREREAERVGSPSPMGIHPQAIPAGGSVHGGSLVGGEGEGGPVGGEGEGGRLGLFSSPLPGLFSSPHPGLFSPLLPGALGLITGASAGADAGGRLTPGGGTHDPEAWGWGGAAPPPPCRLLAL